MKVKKIALLLFFCIPFLAQAADTTRFVILSSGKVTGTHWMVSTPPNEYQFFYEYNDRGRGPKLNSSALVDADGIVVKYSVKGNDYYKAPVQENYEVSNGVAKWVNHIENTEEEWGWLGSVAARKGLAIALSGMMADGEIARERAFEIARMVMRGNAARLYRIGAE